MSREGRRRWAFNERFLIGQQDNPMLQRWRLIQTPLFGIYVHFIYREDLDRAPHDHPWRFWSLVLRGGYQERYHPDVRFIGQWLPSPQDPTVATSEWRIRWHRRGSLHPFPLRAAHRITKVMPGTVTLVLVGRKVRTWGFYEGGRFVDYRAFELRSTEGISA